MTDGQVEPGDAFSDEDFARLEAALGRRLPEGYAGFVKTYGDAFVGGSVDGNPALPILSFLSPEKILSVLGSHDDLKDGGILPFARCELGNLWVIDASGAIHYVNYYGGQTTGERVDDAFERFVSRIVVEI